MALLQILTSMTGGPRFTLEAYKKAQHVGKVTGLHRIASQHLAGYLEDMAEAELER
jgi:truncated hemoglobin YjbI